MTKKAQRSLRWFFAPGFLLLLGLWWWRRTHENTHLRRSVSQIPLQPAKPAGLQAMAESGGKAPSRSKSSSAPTVLVSDGSNTHSTLSGAPVERLLEGSEVWNRPGYEACRQRFQKAKLRTTIPIHIVGKRRPDGTVEAKVQALADCAPQHLVDFTEVDLPACELGDKPRVLALESKCEQLRIEHLQQFPENLPENEKGEFEYYFFHKPADSVPNEPIVDVELPSPETQLKGKSIHEVNHRLATLSLVSNKENPTQDLVICADFSTYSRDLYEKLVSLAPGFPNVQIHWVLRPHQNNPSSVTRALAHAATMQLGDAAKAMDVIFDLQGSVTTEDLITALSSLGHDAQQLEHWMTANATKQRVASSMNWCESMGAKHTPTMLFRDEVIVGTRSIAQLKDLLTRN